MAWRWFLLLHLPGTLANSVIPVDRLDISYTSTIIESSTLIESCFSETTSISITSCTGLNVAKVPICISTTLTAFTTLNNISSSIVSTSAPSSSQSSSLSPTNTTTAAWFGPTAIAIDGLCGETTGQTCIGSTWGSCCSASGDCGHNAFYCGIGCQNDYGHCSSTSVDGSCGNGLSCLGTEFGNCCSASYYCGNGTEFCGQGCQLEYGTCGIPTSTSWEISTTWSSSMSTTLILSSSMNLTNATNLTSSMPSSTSSLSSSFTHPTGELG